jgi:sulfofructose kinase
MKVLGIGEIVLDKSCILEEYPSEGTKIQPEKVEYSIGGPVTAALILLSKLGAECTLLASVGKDDSGSKVKTMIKKYNIQFIPHLQKHTKVNTFLVNKKNGSRTGIKSEVKHNLIQKISVDLIKSVDLIIFDRHEPLAFDYVIANKLAHTKVIVDPSTEVSAKTMKMMQNTDYPIIPIESLGKVRRHEDILSNLQNLYNITQKTLIITAGEMGALIYNGQNIDIVPAVNVDVKDTLGAGDIFRGAFGYGLLQNWDLYQTVKFANNVAALQCTKIGNSTAIPSKNEIEQFMTNSIVKTIDINDIFN